MLYLFSMPIRAEILGEYNAKRLCADKGTICHAPESSLYFGRDGAVSACCYSRNAALGCYPDQSIDEIWNGAVAESMRASMRRNELPGGCDLCADQLHAGNFSGLLARQFDEQSPVNLTSRIKSFLHIGAAPKRYPARLEFELSNKCNLECTMCSGFFSSSIRANRENLPALPRSYDSRFVKQLLPYLPHLTHAKFLGGEPFLIDIYYEIWDRLMELNPGCKVSITTNGTVYTEKVKRVLRNLNCEIVVSIDSVVKATYESIRRNAKMERTLANFEAFAEFNRHKKLSLSIAICPMISNAAELPGLVEFASERGARVFFNTVVFPASHSIKALHADRQREILGQLREVRREPRSAVDKWNLDALEGCCRQIEFWIEEQESKITVITPFVKRCAELLASDTLPAKCHVVLKDLMNDVQHGQKDLLVHIEGGNPVEKLKEYFRALWYLGSVLQSEGMLPGTHFDPEQERLLLAQVSEKIGPAHAQKIYAEIRRFPKILLGLIGTTLASKLGDMLDAHLARPALRD
jgi:MoaA/NifB/PqqE/SkfB family radical SAM enzyme